MNQHNSEDHLIQLLNNEIISFSLEKESSYDALLEKIGDARIVLLGEATHGSHEFYQARIKLSQALITQKGFNGIAIEGDWTSTFQIHSFIQGGGDVNKPENALKEFNRFPAWMWRNEEIISFIRWLRQYNDALSKNEKVGFYGLDLYCLNASMQAVIDYLSKVDPKTCKKVKRYFECFDHAAIDPETYGYLVNSNLKKACSKEAIEQLLEMYHLSFNKLYNQHLEEDEQLFYAMQNSRLIKNAESYYRSLFEGRDTSWNIRDQHMTETLQNLLTHLETIQKKPAKIIIFAHNSHVGDARATENVDRNEINLGQLVREQFSNISFHVGFSTYQGTVLAADHWDADGEVKKIVPGLPSSFEALFHELKYKDFLLFLHNEPIYQLLKISRLQRAIGVIYRPETELESHYFFTQLPHQFDAIIHIDKTTALKALNE